jgi:hypothetical protein
LDDDVPGVNWQASKVQKVQLVCEDFAGNFTSPWYGSVVRPGADYYASKLKLYCFIIADISRNVNYVKLYDERAMGKDANALCSLRFVHHLTQLNCTPVDLRPTILFEVLDNNVGQNKSQVVFMFFALLSMTLYREGVVLLFLCAGHSHMAPDRTVSWLRKSLTKKQVFLPEEFLEAFNSVRSVVGEFINHNDSGRMIFERWEEILKAHFAPIPAIKDGGYTQFHFFEFRNGVLNMRHHPESTVEHTHVYLQRRNKYGIDSTHELLVERCLKSLERHLFYPGKTFANATPQDIDVTSSIGLIRHRRKEMPESQIRSFWTKGFSIPLEYLSYYPPLPTACVFSEAVPVESSEPVRKKGRKSQHSDTMKIVTKHLGKPTTATSVSNNSIARFFSPSATVCSTPLTLGPAKVSKEPMIWHQELSPLDDEEDKEYEWGEAEGSVLFGDRSALVEEDSASVVEDSALVEVSSSPLVGEGSALVEESTAIFGDGSGFAGELLAEGSAPPIQLDNN